MSRRQMYVLHDIPNVNFIQFHLFYSSTPNASRNTCQVYPLDFTETTFSNMDDLVQTMTQCLTILRTTLLGIPFNVM